MPSDISISAITTATAAQPTVQHAGQFTGQSATVPSSQAGPATAPPVPSPQFPNPSLRLDSSLGMVVIEFRDPGGDVTRSIPSQRQIDAYRSHQIDTLPGTHATPATPSPEAETPNSVKSDAPATSKDTA